MTPPTYRLSLDSIQAAAGIIDPVFLQTPQYKSDSLSELLRLNFVTKIETLNPIRCFKGRGSDLLVTRADPGRKLICASAGNFGQAMAYSCRKRKIPLTVYASKKAGPYKLERMKALGARVVQSGEDFDSAKTEARRAALAENSRFVEDSLDIETLEVTYDAVQTIADGIAVRLPVPQALIDMEGLADDGILVSEENIINAMQLIHRHLGLVTEPSGAVGLAALLENPDRFAGQTIATILCGGNLSETQMKEWLS